MVKRNGCTKALVIVHGRSEFDIVKHIKSKLRIPIEIYQKNGGERSIEIQSILDILNGANFKTKKNFLTEYPKIETDGKGNPINFRVFIIVDVDGNNKENVDRYLNKSMFKNHWLYNYVEPILNDNNLEEVLNSIGYTAAKNNKEKKKYRKVFPVERGKQDMDTVISLRAAFKASNKSNFDILLDYCLDNCPKF